MLEYGVRILRKEVANKKNLIYILMWKRHGKCIFKQNALLFPIAAEPERLVGFFSYP
jgi:hypothetical protein